jgi:hypothetical protein
VDLPVLVLILALLLAIAWLMRKRAESAGSGSRTNLRRKGGKTEFHSVSISLSKNACAAAEDLSGHRFLATKAPMLPLPGCDADECTCRFQHHKDRRSGKDRRNPFSPGVIRSGTSAGQSEHRGGTDRRKKD